MSGLPEEFYRVTMAAVTIVIIRSNRITKSDRLGGGALLIAVLEQVFKKYGIPGSLISPARLL
jgi:hypothetical protein